MPSFFDLQINGYAGIDFNRLDLTEADLVAACEVLKQHHVQGVLLTLITDSIENLTGKIKNIAALRNQNESIREMIAGLHIEGPYLSGEPGYIGAHPPQFAKQSSEAEVEELLEAGQGILRIVTLAPEQDPGGKVTRRLSDSGVLVSAGHTNATLEELDACIEQGLSLFTHLGNGCPRLLDRHDNIIQRALSRKSHLKFGLIADGAHVPFFMLQIMLDMVGLDRAFVVSDAIAAAACGPGNYDLNGQPIVVGEDLIPRSPDNSHLAGSGTPLYKMAELLSQQMGLTSEQINRLTLENPLAILKNE